MCGGPLGADTPWMESLIAPTDAHPAQRGGGGEDAAPSPKREKQRAKSEGRKRDRYWVWRPSDARPSPAHTHRSREAHAAHALRVHSLMRVPGVARHAAWSDAVLYCAGAHPAGVHGGGRQPGAAAAPASRPRGRLPVSLRPSSPPPMAAWRPAVLTRTPWSLPRGGLLLRGPCRVVACHPVVLARPGKGLGVHPEASRYALLRRAPIAGLPRLGVHAVGIHALLRRARTRPPPGATPRTRPAPSRPRGATVRLSPGQSVHPASVGRPPASSSCVGRPLDAPARFACAAAAATADS